MRPNVALPLAALLFGSALWIWAQTTAVPAAPPQAPAKPQFFAGTVTDLTVRQITVSRTAMGRAPEKRTFVINPKTKMNKAALKVKSRVTVRYQHVAAVDVALEILLQPRVRPSHSTTWNRSLDAAQPRRFFAQPGFSVCLVRPMASESSGTSLVMVEPAAI